MTSSKPFELWTSKYQDSAAAVQAMPEQFGILDDQSVRDDTLVLWAYRTLWNDDTEEMTGSEWRARRLRFNEAHDMSVQLFMGDIYQGDVTFFNTKEDQQYEDEAGVYNYTKALKEVLGIVVQPAVGP